MIRRGRASQEAEHPVEDECERDRSEQYREPPVDEAHRRFGVESTGSPQDQREHREVTEQPRAAGQDESRRQRRMERPHEIQVFPERDARQPAEHDRWIGNAHRQARQVGDASARPRRVLPWNEHRLRLAPREHGQDQQDRGTRPEQSREEDGMIEQSRHAEERQDAVGHVGGDRSCRCEKRGTVAPRECPLDDFNLGRADGNPRL
jgi:hypothetical protein